MSDPEGMEEFDLQAKLLSSLPRKRAPKELDRRVAEEMRDAEGFVRRWLRRLLRVPAPAALWARVRDEMVLAAYEGETSRGRLVRWGRWAGAAAAAVLLTAGTVLLLHKERPPRRLPLVVLDVQAPGGLSLASSGMVEGAFGLPSGAEKKKD